MRRTQLFAAAALLIAGLTLAALVTARAAGAWTIDQVPNGYGVSATHVQQECDHIVLIGHTNGQTFDWNSCSAGYQNALTAFLAANPNGTYEQTVDDMLQPSCWTYQLSGGGQTSAVLNSCDSNFDAQLTAFIDSTICTVNPSAGQLHGMCMPTTATTVPEATTTSSAPPPPPAGGTTTTVTVTAPAPTTTGPTVDERLAALEAQYAALASRVDAISKANGASWDAFIAVIEKGGSVGEAALAARSAGLNAVYEL